MKKVRIMKLYHNDIHPEAGLFSMKGDYSA